MSQSLPPLLQEIAEVVDLDAAIKLAEIKGGQRISIPGLLRSDHWLVQLLGMDRAKKLCQYFTNGKNIPLDIPLGPSSSAAMKERRYAQLIEAGKSANEIAAIMHIGRRSVFKVKKRHQKTKQTEDLFSNLK